MARRAEDVASVALQGMEAVVNQAWAPAMSLLGPEAGGSSSDPSAPLFSASEKGESGHAALWPPGFPRNLVPSTVLYLPFQPLWTFGTKALN